MNFDELLKVRQAYRAGKVIEFTKLDLLHLDHWVIAMRPSWNTAEYVYRVKAGQPDQPESRWNRFKQWRFRLVKDS